MDSKYEKLTLVSLRSLLWERELLPKKWMLNYVKKAEVIHLLENVQANTGAPESYIKTIKERCSAHRKKVYRSKKNRQSGVPDLTREERLKLVLNTANSLIFVSVEETSGFTSYLGSKKGKVAFVFKDSNETVYQFTRSEVERLSSMGLYIPRGVLSSSRTKVQKPVKATNTLKDLFGH